MMLVLAVLCAERLQALQGILGMQIPTFQFDL
jgi:hypothetical protein